MFCLFIYSLYFLVGLVLLVFCPCMCPTCLSPAWLWLQNALAVHAACLGSSTRYPETRPLPGGTLASNIQREFLLFPLRVPEPQCGRQGQVWGTDRVYGIIGPRSTITSQLGQLTGKSRWKKPNCTSSIATYYFSDSSLNAFGTTGW